MSFSLRCFKIIRKFLICFSVCLKLLKFSNQWIFIIETLIDCFSPFWNKTLHALFSVCNHRQVTNVSGFLCRWRTRPGTTATRCPAGVRTQTPPATHPTPRRPITHSIVTGRMIAAGVSGPAALSVHSLFLLLHSLVWFRCFTSTLCFPATICVFASFFLLH